MNYKDLTLLLNCGGAGFPLSWIMALALPRLLLASQL